MQFALEAERAKADFELKAAEIVLNSESPYAAAGKAGALAKLFPDRLPPDFAKSFDPKLYSASKEDAAFTRKNEHLRMITENLGQKQQVIDIWQRTSLNFPSALSVV